MEGFQKMLNFGFDGQVEAGKGSSRRRSFGFGPSAGEGLLFLLTPLRLAGYLSRRCPILITSMRSLIYFS
jgi:hypothetical protein